MQIVIVMWKRILVAMWRNIVWREKKWKVDALLLLDSIAYARLNDDYVVAMEKLKTYNSDLAKWVEENSP